MIFTSSAVSLSSLFDRAIYVISDSPEVLKQAIADGAVLIQLRDKSGNAEQIKTKSRELLSHPRRKEFLFILNDDPRLALEIGADGVHIGQDTDSEETRRIVGPNLIIGKTTHALEQAVQAQQSGMDYVSVGPVYPTPTKPGRPAVGLEYVRAAAANLSIPFVAIGGIDESTLDAVLDAGARTIGIVRAAAQTSLFLSKIRNYTHEC